MLYEGGGRREKQARRGRGRGSRKNGAGRYVGGGPNLAGPIFFVSGGPLRRPAMLFWPNRSQGICAGQKGGVGPPFAGEMGRATSANRDPRLARCAASRDGTCVAPTSLSVIASGQSQAVIPCEIRRWTNEFAEHDDPFRPH